MSENKQEILNQKIKDLPFSEDFKSVSLKLGFKTIKEIVDYPVTKLIASNGFTYHMLQELVQFLEERNMANLLKQ